MRKTKEILRLHWEMGLGQRQIARSLGISHSTVKDHLCRAEAAGLIWPLPDDLNDETLEEMLFPRSKQRSNEERIHPDLNYIHRELRKKGVTLQLLWMEYKRENPQGYQYSRFCQLYHQFKNQLHVSMRQVYNAGEKLFVDWAGQTVSIIDKETGETRQASIFVAVLGASNYIYAEASLSQDLPSWIKAHCQTFEFLGGVPSLIVPDNTRTAVTKPNYYEPEVNITYQEMASHYGTVILPARPRKPRDKAKVETGVQIVEHWLLAPLRSRIFFSLFELNQALRTSLQELNQRPFKKMEGSRQILFETLDKPALKPLLATPYEFARWKKARVNIDCHIQVENNFYSVPYHLVHKQVEARISANTVEVFYQGQRIASHLISLGKGRFKTESCHLPPAHKSYREWTPEKLISWAQNIGPKTGELVHAILASRPHPEQGYRSCLGLMRLGRNYSPERLEAACNRALTSGTSSFKSVASILEKGLDQIPISRLDQPAVIIEHANLRGPEYYRQGDDDVC
jgi:transposase